MESDSRQCKKMNNHSDSHPITTIFGRMLSDKRNRAGLSLKELADLSRLPCELLHGYENGSGGQPTFDICYKLAVAINSRAMQGFTIQELWEAASLDGKIRTARLAA